MLKLVIGTAVTLGLLWATLGTSNAAPPTPQPPGPDPVPPGPLPKPPSPKDIPPPSGEAANLKLAEEQGIADGYSQGIKDGKANNDFAANPMPPYEDTGMRLRYSSGYDAGYAMGYPEGKAEFDKAKTTYVSGTASAEKAGREQGYAAGRSAKQNGQDYAPNPPTPGGYNSEMLAVYQTNYMASYANGWNSAS